MLKSLLKVPAKSGASIGRSNKSGPVPTSYAGKLVAGGGSGSSSNNDGGGNGAGSEGAKKGKGAGKGGKDRNKEAEAAALARAIVSEKREQKKKEAEAARLAREIVAEKRAKARADHTAAKKDAAKAGKNFYAGSAVYASPAASAVPLPKFDEGEDDNAFKGARPVSTRASTNVSSANPNPNQTGAVDKAASLMAALKIKKR